MQSCTLTSARSKQFVMEKKANGTEETLDIRDMKIDDFAEVFHLGEQLFTSDYSPSMYRTWDEYEITTLYNSDCELCLVEEDEDEHVLAFLDIGPISRERRALFEIRSIVVLGIGPGAGFDDHLHDPVPPLDFPHGSTPLVARYQGIPVFVSADVRSENWKAMFSGRLPPP